MEGGFVRGHDGVRSYWTRQWQVLDPTVEPLVFTAVSSLVCPVRGGVFRGRENAYFMTDGRQIAELSLLGDIDGIKRQLGIGVGLERSPLP
jgi:hypothetical protein